MSGRALAEKMPLKFGDRIMIIVQMPNFLVSRTILITFSLLFPDANRFAPSGTFRLAANFAAYEYPSEPCHLA